MENVINCRKTCQFLQHKVNYVKNVDLQKKIEINKNTKTNYIKILRENNIIEMVKSKYEFILNNQLFYYVAKYNK